MNSTKKIDFLTPILLAVLICSSNFLNTKLFSAEPSDFAVWFILSLFSFVCGWLINKTLDWNFGGKIVFAVTVATATISLIMVSFFSNYFNINIVLTESLILFSLRNITLGAMAFFGMSVAEVMRLQKDSVVKNEENRKYDKLVEQSEQIADLKVKEAKIKADQIILEAEKKSLELVEKKNRIQNQLSEFIKAEKELIRSYESKEID